MAVYQRKATSNVDGLVQVSLIADGLGNALPYQVVLQPPDRSARSNEIKRSAAIRPHPRPEFVGTNRQAAGHISHIVPPAPAFLATYADRRSDSPLQ